MSNPAADGRPIREATTRVSPLLTKAEYAYDELRAQILTGELAPGAVVSSESLAAALGLSATPIREAMRRLAADDLLVLSAHRDGRVKPLSRAELTGLWEVRRILTAATLAPACQNAGDDELREPQDTLREQGEPAGVQQQLLANRQFHRSIYSRCGNQVLVQLLDSLWDRTDRYRLVLGEAGEDSAAVDQQHVEMAEAFERRDADELLRLFEQHTDGSLERLLSKLEE